MFYALRLVIMFVIKPPICRFFCYASLIFITSPKALTGTVDVEVPKEAPYSYEEYSILQLKVRGEYGRYLTFIGTSKNEYQGTSGYYSPGSPGTLNCTTYNTYTSCNRTGYIAPTIIAPTAGGTQQRKWRYELDCKDMTFDRKGDISSGMRRKGWMNVDEDPTAKEVARKYCPIIHTLFKNP